MTRRRRLQPCPTHQRAGQAPRQHLARAALWLAVVAACGNWSAAQAQSAPTAYTVPAGPLADALARFGTAAGISVKVDPALVAGRSSTGLQGRYGVQEGLNRLLAGSGLQAHEQSRGNWLVQTAQARSGGALPAVHVKAEAHREEAGPTTLLTAEDLERTAPTGMADVVRYQPLVEAPGVVTGASRGASRYDRAGTTGYNIRGVEGNRIGLDVDGIEMPDAVDRAPATSRSQAGTFGVGRDFIDPDMYSAVEITSGTTLTQRSAGGIGGAVSFQSKSPEDFVSADKPFYAGAKLGYAGVNNTFTKGVTVAGQKDTLSGIVSYSRRDGHETKNNSGWLDSYPEDWHSDALLLKGVVRPNSAHRVELTADLYRRHTDSSFEAWNSDGDAVTGRSQQDAKTRRDTLYATHTWTPGAGAALDKLVTRLHTQNTDTDDETDTVLVSPPGWTREVSRNKTQQLGLSSIAEKKIANHALSFGVEWQRLRNEHPFTSTSYNAGQPFPDTTTDRTGVFVQDSIDFKVGGKRLAVVPGLRVDRIAPSIRNTDSYVHSRFTPEELETLYGNARANTIVSPSLSVLYDIQPSLTAYAQWRRGGRAPTNAETFGYWNSGGGFYALVGNRDLKKETSDAFDLGLKGTAAPGVQLNASVFRTHYKDFISYTRYTSTNFPEEFTNIPPSLTVLYKAQNRDTADIYGAEFALRLEHGTWTPAARGVYTTWAAGYSKGQSQTGYPGDKKVDLDTVQPAKAIVGLGYDAPQNAWGLNLTGVFQRGKQAVATKRLSFSNNPGETLPDATDILFRAPGYARFDLTGYWRVSKQVRLSAGIYNLFDKQYWSYASTRSLIPKNARDQRQIAQSTAPGRSFALSLNVDF